MIPRSLYVIYHEVMTNRMGLSTFRVRDTKTLMDYWICSHKAWGWDHENKPKIMMALLLQPNFTNFYTLPCHEEIYALLSDRSEVDWFRMMGEHISKESLKESNMGL